MKAQVNTRDLIVHLVFGVLFLMAAQFYSERMYADAAYYLFHVINSEWFHVEHGRYVLVLSEFLPLLGVRLGMPMEVVLKMYSLGHVLFFYLIFLLARYRFKDHSAGVLLLFLQLLCLEMGYFTPMFELYYGAGLLVLFASILWQNQFTTVRLVLIGMLSVIILTSHPMAILLWAFTLVLHAFENRRTYLKWYGGFAALLVLVLIWKSLSASSYESLKVKAIIDTYRMMPFGIAYISDVLSFVFQYYKELLLLLVCTLAGILIRREYLKALFVSICVIGMLIVINGAHYGFQHSRYQEQVYFPLAWIVALPAVLCFVREQWSQTVKAGFVILCLLIFALKIVAIYQEAPTFERRIRMMEREIDVARSLGVQKGIIGEANVTRRSSVDPNWSYGIETMLLSARQGKDSVVSISLDVDMAFENNASKIHDTDFLMRRWDIKPIDWLNPDYFKLPVGPYHSLTSQYDSVVISDELVAGVEIQYTGDAFHMPRGEFGHTTIRMMNRGASPIPADTAYRINVSYHWYHWDQLVTWDGHRTPLEMDLLPGLEYLQTIDIHAPDQTGHYILVVDLVAEGRRWFGIDRRQEFWVY